LGEGLLVLRHGLFQYAQFLLQVILRKERNDRKAGETSRGNEHDENRSLLRMKPERVIHVSPFEPAHGGYFARVAVQSPVFPRADKVPFIVSPSTVPT
jgi:hypothetical protein